LTLLQWVCALGIAYAIANTTLVLVGDGTSPVQLSQSQAAFAADSRSLPPAPTVAELTKRDLFGNADPANAIRSSVPAVPTRLPLTLEAVFVSSRPEQSSAIISQRGKPGKLYGPGDTLPGNARLSEVEATQVILQRAGVREALAFKSKFQATSHQASQTGPASQHHVESDNAAGLEEAAASATHDRACPRP
jgi:type II secretory pathway component PulC